MRTRIPAPSRAPAASQDAAQTPTITPEMRRAVILAKLQKLTVAKGARAPIRLDTMTWNEILTLADDISQVKRMARSKASMGTLLRIGGRVAAAYGVDMAEVDPCHGSEA